MGNKKSTPKIKNLESQDESDSEEEEVILEISEREECDGIVSLSLDCEKCVSLYGSKLIPIEDLTLSDLPEDLQSKQVLDFILMQEKIAVKLEVKKCGSAPGKTRLNEASGWACVSDDVATEYPTCPLENCPLKGETNHKAYGGITVYTNEHVVSKKEEGVNCKVIFFYDGRDRTKGELIFRSREDTCGSDQFFGADLSTLTFSGVDGLAWGLFVKQYRANKDLVAIETVFHDVNLFRVIAASSAQRLNAWAQIPDALKMVMKEHVIVVSHPHGRQKVVSVGKLLSLEVATDREKLKKETRYLAATCSGSSGAPVISGHYPYRPFTHSSKSTLSSGFENFSLSY